jgi:putative ABC transport system ATP-binding protein
MIQTHQLSFSYTTGHQIAFPDLLIDKGRHFLLLGESGSGKTTLLHLMGGLLRRYNGSIKIDGEELTQFSESDLDHFRGQHVGFIFQRNHLISALTVEKNLMMSPYLAGIKVDMDRIHSILDDLGLHGKRNSRIKELSQGQAQRVAIARAILNKPSILLADEPTSALDDTNCEKVIRLMVDVANKEGSTLIVATHDQRLKNQIPNQIALGAKN